MTGRHGQIDGGPAFSVPIDRQTVGRAYVHGMVARGGHGVAVCVGLAKGVAIADGALEMVCVAAGKLLPLEVIASPVSLEWATVNAAIVTTAPAASAAESALAPQRRP
jgi:hypothetical protein